MTVLQIFRGGGYRISILLFLSLFSLYSVPVISAEPYKIKHITIYEDSLFYSAFPSVIKKTDGEFICAFRRAPNRRNSGNHVDPNSYLVMVRSIDGEHWTKDPELIYANPFGGSQDPCLIQLQNGDILCTSYLWIFPDATTIERVKESAWILYGNVVFEGGYYIKSSDGGKAWEKPQYPPCIKNEVCLNSSGNCLPAFNRGALHQGLNGHIYWAVCATDKKAPMERQSVHLIVSTDNGTTFDYESTIAADSIISFNETSIYETPKGNLIVFLRTAYADGEAFIARSLDGGKTWSAPQGMGFRGHPLNAIRLHNNQVLLTYGFREYPYGIRARILNEECTNFLHAEEIILRSDGDSADIGYTWPVLLDSKRVLVVYYFNNNNGVRSIMGSIINLGSRCEYK